MGQDQSPNYLQIKKVVPADLLRTLTANHNTTILQMYNSSTGKVEL